MTDLDPAMKTQAVDAIARAISAKVDQFDLDGPKRPTINEVAEAAYEAAAAILGPARLTLNEWGRRGGKARAAKLTPERRSEIARKAGATRWAKARSFAAGLSADATTGGDRDD